MKRVVLGLMWPVLVGLTLAFATPEGGNPEPVTAPGQGSSQSLTCMRPESGLAVCPCGEQCPCTSDCWCHGTGGVTSGSTTATTNGSTNSTTNATTNSSTNATTNASTTGSTNSSTTGATNGTTNASTTGTTNSSTTGITTGSTTADTTGSTTGTNGEVIGPPGGTTGSTTSGGDGPVEWFDGNVLDWAKVQPLRYVKSEYNETTNPNPFKATFHFAAAGTMHSTAFPYVWGVPATASWTFSGCGASPATATGDSVTVNCNTTGEMTVTAHVTYQNYSEDVSYKVYVVGGPLTITTNRAGEERENRKSVDANKKQPWMMNWYGHLYEDPVDNLDDPTTLEVTAPSFTQPDGTEVRWVKSGPIEFYSVPGSTTKKRVRPIGFSGQRGNASVNMTFTKVVGTETYTFSDCTDTRYSESDDPDPNATTISVHMPKEFVVTDGGDTPIWKQKRVLENQPLGNNQTGTIFELERAYGLELRSQLGDPMDRIKVQERFSSIDWVPEVLGEIPNINDQISVSRGWTTQLEADEIEDIDHVTHELKEQGDYWYHAKGWDYNGLKIGINPAGFGLLNLPRTWAATNPPSPVVTYNQEYVAGTLIATLGGPGVAVGKYKIEIWTDNVVRTKVN